MFAAKSKKALALFLTFCMVASLIPFGIFGANDYVCGEEPSVVLHDGYQNAAKNSPANETLTYEGQSYNAKDFGEFFKYATYNSESNTFDITLRAEGEKITPPPLKTVSVLVLDISKSMTSNYVTVDGNRMTRLAALKLAAKEYIDAMTDSDYLSIVAYYKLGRIDMGFVKLDTTGKSTAKGVIDNLSSNSRTNVQGGLIGAYKLLNDPMKYFGTTQGNHTYNAQNAGDKAFYDALAHKTTKFNVILMSDGEANEYYNNTQSGFTASFNLGNGTSQGTTTAVTRATAAGSAVANMTISGAYTGNKPGIYTIGFDGNNTGENLLNAVKTKNHYSISNFSPSVIFQQIAGDILASITKPVVKDTIPADLTVKNIKVYMGMGDERAEDLGYAQVARGTNPLPSKGYYIDTDVDGNKTYEFFGLPDRGKPDKVPTFFEIVITVEAPVTCTVTGTTAHNHANEGYANCMNTNVGNAELTFENVTKDGRFSIEVETPVIHVPRMKAPASIFINKAYAGSAVETDPTFTFGLFANKDNLNASAALAKASVTGAEDCQIDIDSLVAILGNENSKVFYVAEIQDATDAKWAYDQTVFAVRIHKDGTVKVLDADLQPAGNNTEENRIVFTNTFNNYKVTLIRYIQDGAGSATYTKHDEYSVSALANGAEYGVSDAVAGKVVTPLVVGSSFYVFDHADKTDLTTTTDFATAQGYNKGEIAGKDVVIKVYYNFPNTFDFSVSKTIFKDSDEKWPESFSFTINLWIEDGEGGYEKAGYATFTQDDFTLNNSENELTATKKTSGELQQITWIKTHQQLLGKLVYISEEAPAGNWAALENGTTTTAYVQFNEKGGKGDYKLSAIKNQFSQSVTPDDIIVSLDKGFKVNSSDDLEALVNNYAFIADLDCTHVHDGDCCTIAPHGHTDECYMGACTLAEHVSEDLHCTFEEGVCTKAAAQPELHVCDIDSETGECKNNTSGYAPETNECLDLLANDSIEVHTCCVRELNCGFDLHEHGTDCNADKCTHEHGTDCYFYTFTFTLYEKVGAGVDATYTNTGIAQSITLSVKDILAYVDSGDSKLVTFTIPNSMLPENVAGATKSFVIRESIPAGKTYPGWNIAGDVEFSVNRFGKVTYADNAASAKKDNTFGDLKIPSIMISKAVTGSRLGSYSFLPEDATFTFGLYTDAEAALPIKTLTISGNKSDALPLSKEFTLNEFAGATTELILKEVSASISGMTCDTTAYTIKIENGVIVGNEAAPKTTFDFDNLYNDDITPTLTIRKETNGHKATFKFDVTINGQTTVHEINMDVSATKDITLATNFSGTVVVKENVEDKLPDWVYSERVYTYTYDKGVCVKLEISDLDEPQTSYADAVFNNNYYKPDISLNKTVLTEGTLYAPANVRYQLVVANSGSELLTDLVITDTWFNAASAFAVKKGDVTIDPTLYTVNQSEKAMTFDPSIQLDVKESLTIEYTVQFTTPGEKVNEATAEAKAMINNASVTVGPVDAKVEIRVLETPQYSVTVNYYLRGTTTPVPDYTPNPYVEYHDQGNGYDVTDKVLINIPGYTRDSHEIIEPAQNLAEPEWTEDVVINVFFYIPGGNTDPSYYDIEVRYVSTVDGSEVRTTYKSGSQEAGSSYNVTAETQVDIDGYQRVRVEGDSPSSNGSPNFSNIRITVYYTPDETDIPPIDPPIGVMHTITVNYYDEATNEVIANQYYVQQLADTEYDITTQVNRAISGYIWRYFRPDDIALAGTLDENIVINVYYNKDSAPDGGDDADIGEPKTPIGEAPDTGDAAHLLGFGFAAIPSAVGLTVLALKGRKKEEDAE